MKYEQLLDSIVGLHARAQAGVAVAANRFLVLRNWAIGAYVVEYEQNGEDRAAYGKRLLQRLSRDLSERGLKGCSADVLERMRQLYGTYPQIGTKISAALPRRSPRLLAMGEARISATASRKSNRAAPRPLSPALLLRFSWSHLVELLRLDDPWKRAFYENECLRGNWSLRQLRRQIGSLLYERIGLSTDKQKVMERGRRQAAEAPTQIADLIRDPYVLEFTGLAELPAYTETELERALLDHLQHFLLELGTGFCFEARQFRVTIGNEHDYVDLVFYHRLLRCHVLLDLKTRRFRHADAGQMNYYLNYFKARLMAPEDNPPVGIILCSDKEQTKVEFATAWTTSCSSRATSSRCPPSSSFSGSSNRTARASKSSSNSRSADRRRLRWSETPGE
ncbi:MAG: DUF1016 family protein [Verrucomicrobia bacterium]|nr:DUF1016 family protein [Verrucomicrobiota bacterium]